MLYVNKKKLEHMLQLVTHKEVLDTIVKTAKDFYVVRDDTNGWCAIIPKDIKHYVPAITTYSEDKIGCYVIKELVTRSYDAMIYIIYDGPSGYENFNYNADEYEVIHKDISRFIDISKQHTGASNPIELSYIGVTLNELAFGLPDCVYERVSHGTEDDDENWEDNWSLA